MFTMRNSKPTRLVFGAFVESSWVGVEEGKIRRMTRRE